MVIPFVIVALGMNTKGLEKRLQELEIKCRIETIQTTALLRSSRKLRKVLETYCYSAKTGVKNSHDNDKEITHEMTRTWRKRENLERES